MDNAKRNGKREKERKREGEGRDEKMRMENVGYH